MPLRFYEHSYEAYISPAGPLLGREHYRELTSRRDKDKGSIDVLGQVNMLSDESVGNVAPPRPLRLFGDRARVPGTDLEANSSAVPVVAQVDALDKR